MRADSMHENRPRRTGKLGSTIVGAVDQQYYLNEVALLSAAATDASRVLSSTQWAIVPARDSAGFSDSHGPRKCRSFRELQFKSHSAKPAVVFLQVAPLKM
jgi:hypothetical protein